MNNRSDHTETKSQTPVNAENAENKSDNSKEYGTTIALNNSSELTSPETCRAGFDD